MNDLLGSTCVVTVTYGSRFCFLSQVIEGALANGAGGILVVDNCADDDCRRGLAQLRDKYGQWLDILSLPANTGSAGGYKAGLKEMLDQRRFDYVWLLDDDNVPQDDALRSLLVQYQALGKEYPCDRLALLSFRDSMKILNQLVSGVPMGHVFPRRSSFRKLHVLDMLEKTFRSLSGSRCSADALPRDCIEIPYAFYGGLFFHRAVLSSIGFPDDRLFLYGDDMEFTYRLSRKGGRIFLIPASRVEDVDPSWKKRAKGSPRVLMADSDLRAYYSLRNSVYFDRYCWADSRLMYGVNLALYFGRMAWYALVRNRWARFLLICRAIRDGHCKHLGRRVYLLDFPEIQEKKPRAAN